MPDAVVIGAGPNGLVAANLLADAGWSVEVLEAQDEPGGAVRHDRGVDPDFTSDLFSSFYPLAAASPVLVGLRLEREGLEWSHAPKVLAHPLLDGRCAVLSRDPEETAASLEAFAPGDGAAWQELREVWERLRPDILDALFTPFPPLRAGARLALRLRAAAWAPAGQDDGAAGAATGRGGVPGRGRQAPARGQRPARGPRPGIGGQRGLRLAHVHARPDLRLSRAHGRLRGAHRRAGPPPGTPWRQRPLRGTGHRGRRTRWTGRRRPHGERRGGGCPPGGPGRCVRATCMAPWSPSGTCPGGCSAT